MNAISFVLVLADEHSRMDQLGHHFKSIEGSTPRSGNWWILLAAVAVVSMIVLLAWGVVRRFKSRSFYQPRRLFLQLCRAHQLSRQQQSLLEDLARQPGVKHLSDVFLEPQWFEQQHLPKSLKIHAAEMEEIHDALFAE